MPQAPPLFCNVFQPRNRPESPLREHPKRILILALFEPSHELPRQPLDECNVVADLGAADAELPGDHGVAFRRVGFVLGEKKTGDANRVLQDSPGSLFGYFSEGLFGRQVLAAVPVLAYNILNFQGKHPS